MPVFASTVTVELATDKVQYTPESTVVVTGKVLKDGKAGTGTKPLLKVLNENGETTQAYQWKDTDIGTEGQISTSVKLGKKAVNGTYKLVLTAGGVSVTKQITVTGSTVTETMNMNINKVEYNPNEVVHISGKVLLGDKPANNRTVSIKVEKETVLTVQSKVSDALGEFQYDYQIPASASAGTYKVTATLAGTEQKIVKEFVVKTAPVTPPPNPGVPGPPSPVELAAPEVNAVTSESMEITGKSEKNSTVTITDKDKMNVSGRTLENGTFRIKLLNKIKEGTKLYATASDSSGKVSKEIIIIVLDKTPPKAPSFKEVSDLDTKLTGSAEKGSKIVVKAGTSTVAQGTANAKGDFSISIKPLRAGTQLTATATDTAGNVSALSKVVVKDKKAPTAPIVKAVGDSDRKVTGKADSGSTVVIKVGRKVVAKGTSNSKGDFSLSIPKLKAKTTLEVTATDKAGNVSRVTKVQVKDKTAPAVPTVHAVKSSAKYVTGKAEPHAKIYIKVGKKVIGSATVTSKGNFTIKIAKQKSGTTLVIYAIDQAGNVGKSKSVKVK